MMAKRNPTQAGLLNGQVPATVAQAQLLNAVCQVAYGGGS